MVVFEEVEEAVRKAKEDEEKVRLFVWFFVSLVACLCGWLFVCVVGCLFVWLVVCLCGWLYRFLLSSSLNIDYRYVEGYC